MFLLENSVWGPPGNAHQWMVWWCSGGALPWARNFVFVGKTGTWNASLNLEHVTASCGHFFIDKYLWCFSKSPLTLGTRGSAVTRTDGCGPFHEAYGLFEKRQWNKWSESTKRKREGSRSKSTSLVLIPGQWGVGQCSRKVESGLPRSGLLGGLMR